MDGERKDGGVRLPSGFSPGTEQTTSRTKVEKPRQMDLNTIRLVCTCVKKQFVYSNQQYGLVA